MSEKAPRCIVLGGSNGAGKTTSARSILAETLKVMTFVNADIIAQGLSGFDPDNANLEAGKIMLARLYALAQQRADFALESTMSGRTTAAWLSGLRDSGYVVELHYFWLESPDLAVARVTARVRKGGHSVPEETVRRRYRQSIRNFLELYRPASSAWWVYNNSHEASGPRLVATGTALDESVLDPVAWSQLRREGDA